ATPTPPPTGSPYILASAGDITIRQPIVAPSVSLTAGGRLDVNSSIQTGGFTFSAGRDSSISGPITANTLNGNVQGDLTINRTLNVDRITLDLTGVLNYSAPLVAATANGTFTMAPAAGRQLTIFAQSIDLNMIGGGDSGGDEHSGGGRSDQAPITLNGGDANFFSRFGGGDGGILNLGTVDRPLSGDINVNAPISATTGRNALGVAFGGDGGTVSLVSNNKVMVNDQIKVSDSAFGRASRKGGKIIIDSRQTNGVAVQIKSSAQLLALLSNAAPGPGGTIKITSTGGDIKMDGTAIADRGTVEIRNDGASGQISMKDATLRGDVVKIGALGNNGTLTIDGGNISADSLIKLYAGGSNGTVLFKNNVTLSGNSFKTIAGNTVTIVNGKFVTVLGPGPANVFTNHPNYTGFGGNASTTGTFLGQGATTQPLNAAPGY
ncbi:MAG: hypothetical protein ABI992_09290, partial [Chthoniobacterales bacterium]